MNTGKIDGDVYIKSVSFNKAILWSSREISINEKVFQVLEKRGVKKVIFEDDFKKERLIADFEKVKQSATLKQVGQEPQYYIPLATFNKEKYAS